MTAEPLAVALSRLEEELASGEIELPTFKDAEIAAVTPLVPTEDRRIPLPAVDGLDETELEKAIEAARESLVERGFLREEEPEEPVDELALILEFRSSPNTIVVVDHMSQEGDDYVFYLYGIGSVGYLCEATEGDKHKFTVRSISAVADMLVDVIDPNSQAGVVDGPEFERRGEVEPPSWEKVEEAAQTTHTITRLFSSLKTAPDTVENAVVLFAAGEDGVWGYSSYADGGELTIYACSLSRESVRVAIGDFLGEETQEE
ncbi:MAG: hypothetical protein WBQ14_08830 [Gaiellaceae bacterium]